MATRTKTITTGAITGSVHTPSMSPYLPVTPEEIIEASVGAVEAGAAIIHLHARDPETGKPDQTPDTFGRFPPQNQQRTGAVLNLTTGAAAWMRVDERVKPAASASGHSPKNRTFWRFGGGEGQPGRQDTPIVVTA